MCAFSCFNNPSLKAPECRSHVAMHNTVLKFCKDVECEWVYNQDSDVISIHYDVLEVSYRWSGIKYKEPL